MPRVELVVRKARQFGLHTDSSHRFERGVDPELAKRAMQRATQLIIEHVGGAAGSVISKLNNSAMQQKQLRMRTKKKLWVRISKLWDITHGCPL